MSFLGFTSTSLGSEVSCPRTLAQKNPDDPVQLEPSTPGLRVKHFTGAMLDPIQIYLKDQINLAQKDHQRKVRTVV